MAAQSEQEVQAYLDTHKIQATVEEAINACVKANAPDPCLFMSTHLASKAAPETILNVHEAADGFRGYAAMHFPGDKNRGSRSGPSGARSTPTSRR